MWPVWLAGDVFGMPLRLTGYGLLAALGVTAAIAWCVWSAPALGFARFDALAACALGLAFGLIGAKLLYLAVSVGRMRMVGIAPLLARGGLVWYGGLLGGGAAVLLYLRAYRLDVARFADLAAPALALGHAFGRVGCFCAGCCYGRPTGLPWAVRFGASDFFEGPVGVPLHPVQLYEAAAELLLAWASWRLGRGGGRGVGFAFWLVAYGAVRLVVELAFRGDDRGAGPFGAPPSVALSCLGVALGAWLLQRSHLTKEKTAG